MHSHQKIVLDTRRTKKNHLYPVKIRVTYNRKQKYFYTGIDLSERNFERIMTGSVRSELRKAKLKIADFENRIESITDSMDNFSWQELKRLLDSESDPESGCGVFELFDKIIEYLTEEGRIGNANAYKDAKNSVENFRSKLSFEEITPEFLKSYETYMLKKNRSQTTIGIYLRHLRGVFNKAIESGLVEHKHYPFGKSKYQIKAPRNIKKALTLEQIKQIMEYEVTPDTNQQLAKDMWLLSYFCNGMNIKDMLNLQHKNIQGDTLQYVRAKTSRTLQNPKPIVVSLIPQSIEIIKRWSRKEVKSADFLFPIFDKNMTDERKAAVKQQFVKTINKYMKRIGEEIGFEKPLTTYTARHSFATVLKRSGASMELISESLGHRSLQTTEAYLDSFEDETRRKFTEMLVPN